MELTTYPPIADYAYIADCHSAALVSRAGSIDWCCMPRIDSRSCFGRLLGWQQGGYCQIVPDCQFDTSRRYVPGSLVLETTFSTEHGAVRLCDCFTMRRHGLHEPHRQVLRIIEGVRGRVPLRAEIVPRFDYGSIKPWIRLTKAGHHIAIGGSDGLLVSGDVPIRMRHRHDLEGRFEVTEGRRFRLSILWRRPEALDQGEVEAPPPDELDRRFKETVDWWQRWSNRCTFHGSYREHIVRSATVLKGLSNAPTGAIAAAPTTSLPESTGGSRNWDYRFSWIRDSSFTVRSLGELGYEKEADGFRRFIERSAAGSADQLQILYGVGGERRLQEIEIDKLEGYGAARPVRVGNAAETQIQMDVYGELLDLAWRWNVRGHSPDDDYWEFLVELVNQAVLRWRQPDRGIWEMRGHGRHFVQSKTMCWAAVDRGIRLARQLQRDAPLETWSRARQQIRQAIERQGYDPKRGIFIQAFEHPVMDASVLLLPAVGFIAYGDDRMIHTVDAIREGLGEDGLLRRYPDGEDGLDGREGVFLACSFWLAECLARQGRRDEAREVFERTLSAGNDLLLFSEQFDTKTGRMLGNFPQGLTHLSLISAAVALADASAPAAARGRQERRSAGNGG
jgi:GH15 family glucan-1,4-alpha-glucosidase